MDCKELSPNALNIFKQIKKYYPPDPWNEPRWTEEGKVFDNGWYDLRTGGDRGKLIGHYEYQIGATVVIFAEGVKKRNEELTESVLNLSLSKKWIELTILLKELDFQIETLDLVED